MSNFEPYDWRESLISDFTPEEIACKGFKYRKQIPEDSGATGRPVYRRKWASLRAPVS